MVQYIAPSAREYAVLARNRLGYSINLSDPDFRPAYWREFTASAEGKTITICFVMSIGAAGGITHVG